MSPEFRTPGAPSTAKGGNAYAYGANQLASGGTCTRSAVCTALLLVWTGVLMIGTTMPVSGWGKGPRPNVVVLGGGQLSRKAPPSASALLDVDRGAPGTAPRMALVQLDSMKDGATMAARYKHGELSRAQPRWSHRSLLRASMNVPTTSHTRVWYEMRIDSLHFNAPFSPTCKTTVSCLAAVVLEALTAASGCALGATVTVGVLALQQRMRALHMLARFDHVLLLCETDGANLTEYRFPGITVIGLNCSDIKHTVAPPRLRLWVDTFPKLLALGLTSYHKILLVDMDVLLVADPTQVVVETKAPAMVEWEHFPTHEFNSGVLLIEPSRQLYRDALATLVAGTRDGWNQTTRAIELWQLLQNEAGAPHEVVVGDAARAARASIFNSDQEFLYAFTSTARSTAPSTRWPMR